MLIIRKEQMEAFREAMKRPYVAKLLAYLREENAEAVAEATEDECLELIHTCIRKAGDHGLHALYDVQQFLQCALWHGPDFDTEQEWARTILADPTLPPEEKAFRLEEAAADNFTEEA